jgi:UDP-N-acetylmuramate--alanine ligase
VSGEALVAAMQKNGGRVEYAASMQEAVARLAKDAKPGDMVLTMGAGNVVQAGGMLLEALKARG